VLDADGGIEDKWEALILKHETGEPIAFIEKNLVLPGQLGADELQEFVSEVSHYKPTSAAAWLEKYLSSVKVIYSFQLLHGTEVDNGFEKMRRVYASLWGHAGGVLQADQEGFSNESGYTILWQFSDDVSGAWGVGILLPNGRWVNFEMDLGNPQHREAFWRGDVPTGVKLISEQ
jgi:hypothetical protein